MPELDLTAYGVDGVADATLRGRVSRASDRTRAEAAERGIDVTDILTCAASDAAGFERGGFVQDADGNRWQLVAPQRMPGASNSAEARWQLNEEGVG